MKYYISSFSFIISFLFFFSCTTQTERVNFVKEYTKESSIIVYYPDFGCSECVSRIIRLERKHTNEKKIYFSSLKETHKTNYSKKIIKEILNYDITIFFFAPETEEKFLSLYDFNTPYLIDLNKKSVKKL